MRVLVYDGDCALCEAASRRLVAWAGVAEERRRPHLAFRGAALDRLLAVGLRDALVVVDEPSGEVRTGVGGILWWLRETPRARLARLLDRPALRALLGPPYRLVAFNRRVIAPPPPRAAACACDPSPHPAWQAAFAALLGAVGLAGLAALVAGAWAASLDRAPWPGRWTWALLLAAGTLVARALGALGVPPGRRLPALAHRLWPFAAAAGPFLAGAGVATFLPSPWDAAVLVAAALGGLAVLARSWARRRPVLAAWRP